MYCSETTKLESDPMDLNNEDSNSGADEYHSGGSLPDYLQTESVQVLMSRTGNIFNKHRGIGVKWALLLPPDDPMCLEMDQHGSTLLLLQAYRSWGCLDIGCD